MQRCDSCSRYTECQNVCATVEKYVSLGFVPHSSLEIPCSPLDGYDADQPNIDFAYSEGTCREERARDFQNRYNKPEVYNALTSDGKLKVDILSEFGLSDTCPIVSSNDGVLLSVDELNAMSDKYGWSEREFDCVRLYYGEGKPLKEVGNILGINQKTVHEYIRRAKRRVEIAVKHKIKRYL